MKLIVSCLMIGLLSMGTMVSHPASQQEEAAAGTNSQSIARGMPRSGSQRVGGTINGFPATTYWNNRQSDEVGAALRKLKAADSDDARKEAEGELKTALESDYDDRLADYEKNLDALEDEIKKMREQLKRRRNAKDEMVRLRIEVLKAEADDLGWPSRSVPRSFRSGARGGLRYSTGTGGSR